MGSLTTEATTFELPNLNQSEVIVPKLDSVKEFKFSGGNSQPFIPPQQSFQTQQWGAGSVSQS